MVTQSFLSKDIKMIVSKQKFHELTAAASTLWSYEMKMALLKQ